MTATAQNRDEARHKVLLEVARVFYAMAVKGGPDQGMATWAADLVVEMIEKPAAEAAPTEPARGSPYLQMYAAISAAMLLPADAPLPPEVREDLSRAAEAADAEISSRACEELREALATPPRPDSAGVGRVAVVHAPNGTGLNWFVDVWRDGGWDNWASFRTEDVASDYARWLRGLFSRAGGITGVREAPLPPGPTTGGGA